MNTDFEKLRRMLSLETTERLIVEDEYINLFDEIAKFLIEECVISWNEYEYGFQNIEFYLYNKNHKDIITHPRISKALQWYINDFGGIDINFESKYDESNVYTNNNAKKKPILNDNCCFGGILIRKLKLINQPEDHQTSNLSKGNQILEGPLACAEMFRLCDAENGECSFPKLKIMHSGLKIKEKSKAEREEIEKNGRHNILRAGQTARDKVKNILSGYVNEKENVINYDNNNQIIEDMIKQFNKYKYKPYWYSAE